MYTRSGILMADKEFKFNDHDDCEQFMEFFCTLFRFHLSDYDSRMEIPDITRGPAVWTLVLYK